MGLTRDVVLTDVNVNSTDCVYLQLSKDGVPWPLEAAVVTFTFTAPDGVTTFSRTATVDPSFPGQGFAFYNTLTTDIVQTGWWSIVVTVVDNAFNPPLNKTYPYRVVFCANAQPGAEE